MVEEKEKAQLQFQPAEPKSEIVVAESQLATRPERSLLSVIAAAVSDPRVDVEKMERLLAMHEKIVADQRKSDFAAAMSRLQPKLPRINKNGVIMNKDGVTVRNRYAKYEDICEELIPLLAEEGFSLKFDVQKDEGKLFLVFLEVRHSNGHSEVIKMPVPLDASQYRTDIQNYNSTVSIAKRVLIKNYFNIIEEGADDDGQGGSKPITQNQADTIRALMEEVKANKEKFLRLMCVEKLEDILSCNYKMAVNALETKRRTNASA